MEKIIDCKGMACPLPVVNAKKASEELHAGDVLTVYASDGRQLGDDEVEVYSTTGLRLNPASLQRGIVLVRALGAVRSVAL